jgi:hypothetical protein
MLHDNFDFLSSIVNNTDLPTLVRVQAIEALLGNGNTMASDAIRDAAPIRYGVTVTPMRSAKRIRCRVPVWSS